MYGQFSQKAQEAGAFSSGLQAIQAEIAQLTSAIDEAERKIAGLAITPQDSFNFDAFGVGSYVLEVRATDLDVDRDNDQLSSSVTRVVNVLNSPPTADFAVVTAPVDRKEGSAIEFSASASTDPENDGLTFVWNFGDGSLAMGENVSHLFADNGSYDVKLVAVDTFGEIGEVVNQVVIDNQAPVLTATSPATVSEASPFVLDISAVDPSTDSTTYLAMGLRTPIRLSARSRTSIRTEEYNTRFLSGCSTKTVLIPINTLRRWMWRTPPRF